MREEMLQNEEMVGDSIQLSHHSRQGQSSFCLADHGRTSSNEGMKSCTTVIFSDTHKLSGGPAGAPSSEGTVMEHFPSGRGGSSTLCHSFVCIWCRYNPGLASTEVLNFQPERICERSRSFGSFEVAGVLVEHPAEDTQHVLG